VNFLDSDGAPAARPTQGQMFSYYGSDVELFHRVFSSLGFVVVPWAAAERIEEEQRQ
jgi:hypothetical protein